MEIETIEIQINSYVNATKNNLLKIGGLLKQVRDNELYKGLGFNTLSDYLDSGRFEFSRRHAFNLIKINDEFGAIPVQSLHSIGIAKLIEIAYVSDREIQEDLLANAPNMNILEVKNEVKKEKDKKLFSDIERRFQREKPEVEVEGDSRLEKCKRQAQSILNDLEALKLPLNNMKERIKKWFLFSKEFDDDSDIDTQRACVNLKLGEVKNL